MKQLLARKQQLEGMLADLDAKLHQIDNELDQPVPSDTEDRASEREDDEVMEAVGKQGLQEMKMIRAALDRIENGTYGACAKCGEEISEERLDLLPFTPFCRRCAG